MLKYIGDGSFLPGVPARDLLDSDLASLPEGVSAAFLIESGLYVETKAVSGGRENKAFRGVIGDEAEKED